MTTTVLVAGATGDLGQRIVRELLTHDTAVRVLTRPGGTAARMFSTVERVQTVEADYGDAAGLQGATRGVDTVISAVSGTRDVILGSQRALLDAAVRTGVGRFIPSDFSADYRRVGLRSNRNLELRRDFAADLDAAPIRATSVLNGAFADLLTGQAPVILFKRRRVLYWSDADQVLDFTTKDDTAWFTARAALDQEAPRVVEIAGDSVSARDIAATMSQLTGDTFTLRWAGTTGTLAAISSLARRASRAEGATFPAWQGMQYLVSMFSGQGQLRHRANDRYGHHAWTTTRDVLGAFVGDS